MDALTIRPNLAPRSFADASITASLLLLAVALLAGLGVTTAHALSLPSSLPIVAVALCLTLLARTRTVRAIHMNGAGIRFVRWYGTPDFLPWEQVQNIRPATRQEVIFQGWLQVPLHPREATASLSSEGHYRIEWENGFTFYPPLDESAFREAVLRWRGIDVWQPELLRHLSSRA